MPDPSPDAGRIARAAASAWWKAHGSGRGEIPLGVVAALALTERADPDGPDPASQILAADRDQTADLLRDIWTLFAIIRPELSIRTGPFAAWLDNPSAAQLDGAHATARAVATAGLLSQTADRRRARDMDLLGVVYQELRNPKAGKTRGEVYTPAALAAAMARLTVSGAEPGQSICDPCAGTGGLLLAAATQLRSQGIEPGSMHWYAADIDPIAVAGLAVNAHLWDLGPHVVIGRADTLAEPDWHARALSEQQTAIEHHNAQVTIARFLAATALLGAAAEAASDQQGPHGSGPGITTQGGKRPCPSPDSSTA